MDDKCIHCGAPVKRRIAYGVAFKCGTVRQSHDDETHYYAQSEPCEYKDTELWAETH